MLTPVTLSGHNKKNIKNTTTAASISASIQATMRFVLGDKGLSSGTPRRTGWMFLCAPDFCRAVPGAALFEAVPLAGILSSSRGAAFLDAVPLEAEPLEAVPLEAGSLDAVPLDAVPLEAVPLDAVPLDAVPLEAVPLEAAPLVPLD
jgi:hypothetical protein